MDVFFFFFIIFRKMRGEVVFNIEVEKKIYFFSKGKSIVEGMKGGINVVDC